MVNGKFGVGIIGCGVIATAHAAAYKQFPNDCELIAVADVRREPAEKLMRQFSIPHFYSDWKDLLSDDRIDIVSICTPHHLHFPMTVAAAQSGKHVLCEKPMAITVGEAHEMIQACRNNHVRLSIASERFNPRHRFIKEQVMPELGPISFSWLVDFYYRDTAYYAAAAWRGNWAKSGGGVCANQAIYTWDMWQWFLGGVQYAYGYWGNILHPTIEVDDIAFGLVTFTDGSYGKFLATTCWDWDPQKAGLRIFGEKGVVFASDPWLYQINFRLYDANRDALLRKEFESVCDPDYRGGSHPWQVADLIEAIRQGRDTLVPEALEPLKILQGLYGHGSYYRTRLEEWVRTMDLPPSVEEGKREGWQGGCLLQVLEPLVKDPSPTLMVPFSGEQ
ncbi:MAG: Gfo/Idh/MocA family oxidoreductase [Armatimonadetes bacterium]|nr:Gfo/Idh/MocA family oxidoreductase [Armatimonadota bacterium]MDW8121744.1 Gfo/Idh/MocA family oxidoreductase [Armatimonadota bacterium]